jgi:hypothetical protein
MAHTRIALLSRRTHCLTARIRRFTEDSGDLALNQIRRRLDLLKPTRAGQELPRPLRNRVRLR